MVKQTIKSYFQFSRRERNGILVLLFVLIALMVLRFAIPLWVQAGNDAADKMFAANSAKLKALAQQDSKHANTITVSNLSLKPFNPNTILVDSLLSMRVPEKLARQIINYRQKVGPFKAKADFAKLYNLEDSTYQAFKPFLLLPESSPETAAAQKTTKKVSLEINSADSLQLLDIKGVGPWFAHKILDYRRQLGGYFSLEQLGEVLEIPANSLEEKQARMQEIKSQLTVNPSLIVKLNVNIATQKELSRHPYIDYKQSKAITKHRSKKEPFKTIDEMEQAGIISAHDKELLVYYLTF